jgi:TolB-like protein/DNA-binding winged helix-turn-helix (wHTH) protein/Tfp pilus assembly protein PilF
VRYFFEEYALDTDRRELQRGPDVVPTTPQVFDLLEYLIRSRDCVVSKDDLVNAIWNGRIVSDAAITTRLNAVRRAIGDSGDEQRLIKTFPRKGFRFVGAVYAEDRPFATAADSLGPAAVTAETHLVAAPPPTMSIAVDEGSFTDLRMKATVSDTDFSVKALGKERRSDRWLGKLSGRLKLFGGALAWVAAVGAFAGGIVGCWNVWKTVRPDVSREAQKVQAQPIATPKIAPRLSFIVLPFANVNNDPAQDYFADAVTTDLTTDLVRAPDALVIGRETAFTYKNKPVDLKKLGTDLDIRWAIQGAVQRNENQVRINVSLTDLQTARDVWSDRFDGSRTDLPYLQDQITARLARSLAIELLQAESRRSEADGSKNLDSMEFSMRGRAMLFAGLSNINDITKAKDLFDKALQLDPENVEAMIGKAGCLANQLIFGWSASVIEDKRQATALIDRALSRSGANPRAHTIKGTILLLGQPVQALAEFNAALAIYPNFHSAHAGKAAALVWTGRPSEAALPIKLALRISPRDPSAFLWGWLLCNVHLHLREYEEAIEQCRRSVTLNNSFWHAHVSLVSAYGSAGKIDEARQVIADLDEKHPNFTVQLYRQLAYSVSTDQQYRRGVEDILNGLRRAGVPEQ